MGYLVSDYCLVPMKAEIEVEVDTPVQAMKIAKAEWKRDPRCLLVSGSDDELREAGQSLGDRATICSQSIDAVAFSAGANC